MQKFVKHHSFTPQSQSWLEPSDAELLAVIKGNDDNSAFNALVARHLNRVTRLCFGVLHNREDAEDAAQEVFISVWNRRKEWMEGGNAAFTTWLHKVAVNKSIDIQRRRKTPSIGLDETHENLVSENEKNSEDHIIAEEQTAEVTECLKQLPEKQMECLMLYYYNELDVHAIGERLHATEDSIRSLLKRGKANLKGMMRDSDISPVLSR